MTKNKKNQSLKFFNNTSIGIISIIIILFLLSLLNSYMTPIKKIPLPTPTPYLLPITTTPQYNTNSKQIYKPDPESTQIATKLLKDFFENYKNSTTPLDQKIDEYVIQQATGIKIKTNIYITVTYSVKRSNPYSVFWSQGNGNPLSDGWVKDKQGCTIVKNSDGNFNKIDVLGTGCSMPE